MKIKRINIMNNDILGNIEIEFTDDNRNIKDMLIMGENGCGKTTLLDIIYNFTSGKYQNKEIKDEINEFTIKFTELEVKLLNQNSTIKSILRDLSYKYEVVFKINYSVENNKKNTISYTNTMGKTIVTEELGLIRVALMRNILRCVYSTSEVSFISAPIKNVTTQQLDEDVMNIKQNNSLATQIAQLIVDIKALDDSDLSDWVNANKGKVPPESVQETRIKRFKKAFDFMFENKRFKGISNNNGEKEVVFIENNMEVSINKLSSGEKQIVFRGGFLLKNSNKSKGAIILIDEPELSLHPKWQMKITEFFKRIFEDEEGKQTSQIFMSTHSPFILHNEYRKNDKIIVLKKNMLGDVTNVKNPKFYSWSSEEAIKEAFDIDRAIESVEKENDKPLIITEGKTDWKHIKNAYEYLIEKNEIEELNIEFLEYEETLGDSRLYQLLESISLLKNKNKIICIFDRDKKDIVRKVSEDSKGYKYSKNKVYSMVLPIPNHRISTPEISIEHIYLDKDIKREAEGKRIYLGSEFSQKSGLHIDEPDIFCVKKNKCGEKSNEIIDSDCTVARANEENMNIAISKNEFADNIINKIEGFKDINFDGFKLLFTKISEILELDDK